MLQKDEGAGQTYGWLRELWHFSRFDIKPCLAVLYKNASQPPVHVCVCVQFIASRNSCIQIVLAVTVL